MRKIVLLLCLQCFVICVFARSKYYSFNAGIEAGFSATTIQPHMPYYGFYQSLDYGKQRSGTAGVFVNRFISEKHMLETGFYYTLKGTYYYVGRGSRSHEGFGFHFDYIEVPIVIYNYPNPCSYFSYRYGLSVCYLYTGNLGIYKDFDTTLSLGIRFRNIENPILKKCQFVLKFDCSILPITYPEKVEIYNKTQRRDKILHPNQRNMGITFSMQYFFKDFFDNY